jgi:hypothetical protein
MTLKEFYEENIILICLGGGFLLGVVISVIGIGNFLMAIFILWGIVYAINYIFSMAGMTQ